MRRTDVLVVGAGPVGTVAAAALAQRGIDVILCEARSETAADLRASTFHAPTLEMLDTLGVADAMIDYGLKAPVYHFRERRTGETIAFDMSELADITAFPFRLQCEQHIMAGMVADRLRAQPNVEIETQYRAVSFEQDDEGVTVSFETPYTIDQIRARYVVAADGGNSILRKWLGAEFTGFTYPEKFLCLSTPVDLAAHIDGLAPVNYVADPDEWLVLLRTPRLWRVLVPADESADDTELLSDAMRDAVFGRLIGAVPAPTEHRTIYRVHQRVVDRFDHGRMFLVGDAAHLNNPLGGFGMNSGIHDVWALADVIETALNDGYDPEPFALWDRQRRGVTHAFIQSQTMQNKVLLEHGAPEAHARRLDEMRATAADPDARRAYLMRQSMFASLRDAAAIQ